VSSEDRHRDLLDRATAALEGIEATVARQAESFDRQAEAFDRQAESHERMMHRIERSEATFVRAIGDIDISLQRNTERLEDMGDAIRADTRAVLSVLDRLGPATG
jgi:glutamine amidotransferase PdxT